ncbi:MAG: hypothetical protein J6R37_03840 [Clostridia bacterium]|nr:hypothetical protein [Clostridia bacterium]
MTKTYLNDHEYFMNYETCRNFYLDGAEPNRLPNRLSAWGARSPKIKRTKLKRKR